MDTVDVQTRSRIMSSVGREHTGPERSLRRALHKSGLRYRLHVRALPGSPDLVFPRFRSVIFVHGCYWHSHGCSKSTVPKSRNDFWTDKFRANKLRDRRNLRLLAKKGWRVMVVWECAITQRARAETGLVGNVHRWLLSSEPFAMIPQVLHRNRKRGEEALSTMRAQSRP
jgi:DNA mismatch endonuclease, patch repair protein